MQQSLPERAPEAMKEAEPAIDYRLLTYVGTVDENLMCPICREPLVDPIDTSCDHTFCKECIIQAFSGLRQCPIDRVPCSGEDSLKRTHKIIISQLDALLVKCTGCATSVPRAMLRNHLEKYCRDGLVPCPGKECQKQVKRKVAEKDTCLHLDAICPDCEEIHQEIDMTHHREELCKEKEKSCQHCSKIVLRCKEAEHIAICPDIIDSCQWACYGCDHASKRKDLSLHATECTFKLLGPMASMLSREIDTLRGEVRVMKEKDQLQDRRIKFLESGQRDSYRADYSEMTTHVTSNQLDSTNAEPSIDSTSEYLLELLEAQETRVNQLSTGLTDLEAKQNVMFLNETMSIKTELAEMRSQQQVLSMHVRWLLNFRRQENQQNQMRRAGGGGGSGDNGDAGGSNSSGSSIIRRLSDSTRDLVTKL